MLVPVEEGQGERRQDVELKVSAEELGKRGIDLGSLVSGQMVLKLAGTPDGQSFDIDLTDATVKLEQIGWEKGPGVAARASFILSEQGDTRRLRDFKLTSDGVAVGGEVVLGKDGGFREADFAGFQIRPGDSASLKVTQQRRNQYKVVFNGAQFDARGLIKALLDKKGGSDAKDKTVYDIVIKAGRLQGFNGVVATDVDGKVTGGPEGIGSLTLKGATNNRGAFRFELSGKGTRVLPAVTSPIRARCCVSLTSIRACAGDWYLADFHAGGVAMVWHVRRSQSVDHGRPCDPETGRITRFSAE
ncbi:hypothetical protein V6L77_25620 [Pannonibacter sp. Pt2-lr]